jgi:hypothetical protein
VVENRLVDAILQSAGAENSLRCAAAFRIARGLDIDPLLVGEAADSLEVKLARCQLGLFGYGPKAEGKHKIVEPADAVSDDLAQAIERREEGGRLPCRAAWDIAADLGVPKKKVSAAAEAMGIKIVRCQLGAF